MKSSIRTHKILQELKSKPIDTLSFPSHFSVATTLRDIASSTDCTLDKLIGVIKKDPLITLKVVAAGSLGKDTDKKRSMSIEAAVENLGIDSTRRMILGITMLQLARSSEMMRFNTFSRLIWLNSMYCAAAAENLSRVYLPGREEDCFFFALSINLGAFYLLYHAAIDPNLRESNDDIVHAIKESHVQRTIAILRHVGIDVSVIEQLEHLTRINQLNELESVPEIVYIASRLANEKYSWQIEDTEKTVTHAFQPLVSGIDADFKKLKSEYRV